MKELAMQLHGMTSHKGSDRVAALLAADDAKPVNVFSVNAMGAIFEGATLSLCHPLTGGRPALIVGKNFILVNGDRSIGCIYRQTSPATGFVRRLDVQILNRDGKKPLPLLVNPTTNGPMYLHVDVETHPPECAQVKERFWYGVTPRNNVVAYGGTETLVRFANDGDAVNVCYEDGSVRQVTRRDNMFVLTCLSPEQQANVRIMHALEGLKRAELLSGDNAIKQRDLHYHRIAAVVAIGGSRSSTVLGKALAPLFAAALSGDIRPQVKAHVIKALGHSPVHALLFKQHCRVGSIKRTAPGGAFGIARSIIIAEDSRRTGPKPERVRKLAERAARDRAECDQKRKDLSGGMQDPGDKNNKKKKR